MCWIIYSSRIMVSIVVKVSNVPIHFSCNVAKKFIRTKSEYVFFAMFNVRGVTKGVESTGVRGVQLIRSVNRLILNFTQINSSSDDSLYCRID
jgi:hypothetical protein